MLKAYREHAAERAALGIPPLPLDAKQTSELIELIKSPHCLINKLVSFFTTC